MEFMSALSGADEIDRPSIFELVAQDKMREMLQPAVRYVLAVYAQRYPRYLLRLVNRHEEFYALLMLLIERHYLKEWGSSFAENFYSLKRVSTRPVSKDIPIAKTINASPNTRPLSSRDIRLSLIFLVGLPYVKVKLDDLYETVSGGTAARLFGDSEFVENENYELADPSVLPSRKLLIWLRKFFRTSYPWINLIYHWSNLGYNIVYMFEKTRYWSPWMHLIGIEVTRMNADDYRDHYTRTSLPTTSPQASTSKSLLPRVAGFLNRSLSYTIEFLKVLLPMCIFFFKFLEWWHSSEFARGGAFGGESGGKGTAVKPPERTPPDPRGVPLPKTPHTCPLCLVSPIVNPTALPSGYVFCYTCAFRYVEEFMRCPVSLMKVRDVDELRKVYAGSMGGI